MACELPQPFPSIFIPVNMTKQINKRMNKYVEKRLITMWSKYAYNLLMSPMIIVSDTVKPGYNLHM
jgi:ferric iron reductase protein FhuF